MVTKAMKDRIKIQEAIVVEGRDDEAAVLKAFDALIITTHGFGITRETWNLIDKAYREKGIIILTDPDFSGEEIRRKVTARCPDAKQAYMPLDKALKDGDIGIENSIPEDIVTAISKAHAVTDNSNADQITMNDLRRMKLVQGEGSSDRRSRVADELGIGYGNSKTFLKKLNAFGITIDMLEEAVGKIE